LERLALDSISCTGGGLMSLAAALRRNLHLKVLSIQENDFCDNAVVALAESMPHLRVLEELTLTCNAQTSNETLARLVDAVENNKTLMRFKIGRLLPDDLSKRMSFALYRNCFSSLVSKAASYSLWPLALYGAYQRRQHNVVFYVMQSLMLELTSTVTHHHHHHHHQSPQPTKRQRTDSKSTE
jgi:hypothetical protein